MRGKYILRRLIFFGIALAIALLSALLLRTAIPGFGMMRPIPDILRRAGWTLMLILIPLIISFVIAMLTGLAKSNGAKNVFRIISAVLRALVPFAFGLVLLDLFAFKWGLLPASAMAGGASWVLPMLALTLPLIGFLMNAAVSNGHKTTFGGSVGAVAAWAADKIPAIVIVAICAEPLFSVPGLGMMAVQSIAAFDSGTAVMVCIIFAFIVYVLRFILDVIAAAASGGDPSEQVFEKRERGDKSGTALLLIGLICAALMIVLSIVLPFLSAGNPLVMDPANSFAAPGTGGFILGSDMYGRDLFTMVTLGMRDTLIIAFTNTLIACVLGTGFGILAGIIKGNASEIFRGIRYVFGHGAPFAILLIIFMSRSYAVVFFAVGLFGWGGIAERIDNGIRARRISASRRASIILPALEQLAYTFCSMIIFTSAAAYLGLTPMNPAFPTLGYLVSMGRSTIMMESYVGIVPAAVLMILLFAFFLLHAGLSARERRNQ